MINPPTTAFPLLPSLVSVEERKEHGKERLAADGFSEGQTAVGNAEAMTLYSQAPCVVQKERLRQPEFFLRGLPLPPLQNPLQRVIDDPPVGVELGYEAIRGVRWGLGAALAMSFTLR